jgi:predicted nucleic acid-binding protein
MYLLDTNIVSETRRPSRHVGLMQWIASLMPSQLFVPSIAFLEMQRGAEITRKQDPQRAVEIERWIDMVASTSQIVDFDLAACREYSRLLRRKPDLVSEDAMIAAIAKVRGYTVVTRNVKDFLPFGVPIFDPVKNQSFPAK